MALSGESKKAYQKEYMRKHRSNKAGSNIGQTRPGLTQPDSMPRTVAEIMLTGCMKKSNKPLPASFGQPDCGCMHCRQNRASDVTQGRLVINHGSYKVFEELGKNEVNRVSLLGDVDYQPPVSLGPISPASEAPEAFLTNVEVN